ncbi:DNA polymerase III subunit delta' [Geobacter sp. OR-1]|uniref:DNA polymerase III subunit delta' n=1 Tax=Geobacter sp. OR-1 TaxID=1266765 RepID=UPI000541D606|nr:DNA polymerase III subunit delta' [Geobacter sp. OR-1]GAM08200.1 DNA polymerase III subunit delta' [Geobacter sp. OR-1]
MPFDDIIGHDRITGILQRAVAARRIAHAYLFVGPEGCGKRKTAVALVEAMYCKDSCGCGKCAACRRVALLQHPDLHILEPDGAFIKIDQVRQLQRELSLRPYEAPFKSCIIEAADRFHPAAGNALLKTLEEPPGNALMILLTANPDAVLQTIRSRCQLLNFQTLSEESVARILVQQGVGQETARLAASLSGGSPGRAHAFSNDEVLSGRHELLEQILSLSGGDISQLFTRSERLAADKENLPELLDLLMTFLRDLLHIQSGSSELVNRDLEEMALREAAVRNTEQVMQMIEHVIETRKALQRNVNARLAMDLLLMRLAA